VLAIARTTTPSIVFSQIPVSCDGRCQLPLLSRLIWDLSILLDYVDCFTRLNVFACGGLVQSATTPN
jgi:hypothetical protein